MSSIEYVSSLLIMPEGIGDGDKSSVAGLVQSYPYFVPARYFVAMDQHRKAEYAPGMLTSVRPYVGNWLLLRDFLEEGIHGRPAPLPVPTAGPEMPETAEVHTVEVIEVAASAAGEQVIVTVEEQEVNEDIAGVSDTDLGGDVVIEIVEEVFEQREEPVIIPVNTGDYFRQQGEIIPDELPSELDDLKVPQPAHIPGSEQQRQEAELSEEDARSLMVMMSFSEWLMHFRHTSALKEEETREQKALKTMWQKEKLAAALEEENDEIPENVFEMAVNSIAREDNLASETLAEVYIKQGKFDKAIDMYRKLSLRNPQKSAYFARKIDEVLKEKNS